MAQVENPAAANPQELSGDNQSILPEKHPLATSWTYWYLDPTLARGGDWNRAQREVLAFDTVEDFWALHHHVTPLSQLKKGGDYSLFRGGLNAEDKIKPAWEDKANKEGGSWKVVIPIGSNPAPNDAKLIDDIFRELLMMCVGESFGDHGEYVNGMVASARAKQYRLAIWTKDSDKDHNEYIGEKLLDVLPSGWKLQLDFTTHLETERASGAQPRSMLSKRKP